MTREQELEQQLAEARAELSRARQEFNAEQKAADDASKEVIQLMAKLAEARAEIERLKADSYAAPVGWVSGDKLAACIESKIEFHNKIKELRSELAAAKLANAELEAEVFNLWSLLKNAIRLYWLDEYKAYQPVAESEQPTTDTLRAIVTRAEERMRERCDDACNQYKRGVMDLVNVRELQRAIRALPAGEIKLEDLLK